MTTAWIVGVGGLVWAACGAPRTGESSRAAPYGSWDSPISATFVAQQVRELNEPSFGPEGISWLEMQADGHNALRLQRRDGTVREVLPGIDVRTEVHAYGGGAYLRDGMRVLYTDAKDQRLYLVDGTGAPRALTPPGKAWFANCEFDRAHARAICVRDDASAGGMPVDSIVAVDLAAAGAPVALVAGHDFFAQPRLSPDGRRLAWLSWDLPRMPWDGSDLWTAPMSVDGKLGTPVHVAGGPAESINQPEWSPDGELYFSSDRTGYWNLYREHAGAIEPMWPIHAEVGRAAWVLDDKGYAFVSPTEIVATVTRDGESSVVAFDLKTRAQRRLAPGYTATYGGVSAQAGRALVFAASPSEPRSLLEIEVATGAVRVIARESDPSLPAGVLSVPEAITYPTKAGGRGFAYYYPPRSGTHRAPETEKPPLIVRVHGGPTSATTARLDPEVLFFTSRGFGYVDVNHGGSTGYGRAYRARLDGQWGVVDVDDSIAAAQELVARGRVDGKRIVIRGGSAGGYTTLAALAFRDFFQAGAAYFGISDLERLQIEGAQSDKFESGYMEQLIGPYPERKDLFAARSPLFAADKIRAPVIFFQGSDDPVVLPNQSRMMHAALNKHGIPTAYLEFAGEKHGFRKAESNARALEAEVYFFRRVLGISTTGPAPVTIENL